MLIFLDICIKHSQHWGNENNSKLNFMKNHQASAQKVTLHNCFFQKYPENFLF